MARKKRRRERINSRLWERLNPDPELRENLKKADVILAVDIHNPENSALFYGERALERIRRTGQEEELFYCQVPIDFSREFHDGVSRWSSISRPSRLPSSLAN